MDKRYYFGIDAIRFVAALLVALYHFCFWSWIAPNSTPGRILGGAAQFPRPGSIHLVRLGRRRDILRDIRPGHRPYPPITAHPLLSSMAGCCGFIPAPGYARQYREAFPSGDAALSRLVIWRGNISGSATLFPFTHTWVDGVYWTLGVEIIFYGTVLWPFGDETVFVGTHPGTGFSPSAAGYSTFWYFQALERGVPIEGMFFRVVYISCAASFAAARKPLCHGNLALACHGRRHPQVGFGWHDPGSSGERRRNFQPFP